MKQINRETYNRVIGILKFVAFFSLGIFFLIYKYIYPTYEAYILTKDGVTTSGLILDSEYKHSSGRRGRSSSSYEYSIKYANYSGEISFPNDIGNPTYIPIVYSISEPSIFTYSDSSNGFNQYYLRLAGYGIGSLIIGFIMSCSFVIIGVLNLLSRGIKMKDDLF